MSLDPDFVQGLHVCAIATRMVKCLHVREDSASEVLILLGSTHSWCIMASWLTRGLLGKISYVLALVGGVVMVISGIASLIGMGVLAPSALGYVFGGDILQMILGVAAFFLAKRIKELVWAIVLVIIGFVGGGIGGVLVAIGGIASLVAIFLKR